MVSAIFIFFWWVGGKVGLSFVFSHFSSRRDCFSPEKAGVKGATSHFPQVAWTDPLHQSRHHSSSAAEPSHVRESYKSERLSVSPSQNYGNTQVEVSSSGSRGTQKKLIGERDFHFVVVLFPLISHIQ